MVQIYLGRKIRQMGTLKKIKVCHLASGDLWAGAENMLASLIAGLVGDDSLEVSAILFNEGVLADRLRGLNIPVWIIPENQNNPLQLMMKTRDRLASGSFNILHTHRYKENLIGAFAAKLIGIGHVACTVHGMPEPFHGFDNFKASIYNFLDIQTKRFLMQKIITVSNDIQNTLAGKINPKKLATVHNGIDLDRLKKIQPRDAVRAGLGLPNDALVIGSVGRMMPVKGYEYLLEAVKKMLENEPKVRLVMVGDGPLKAELEDKAKALGIADQVIFTGFVPETIEIINALDIFVLSSLHEGISISLLESLALGIPAVVTNVGGNPEVVEDGVQGKFVSPRNPGALAEACLSLLNDPQKRKDMGDKGRERIRKEFSKEAMAEKIRLIYFDLIK